MIWRNPLVFLGLLALVVPLVIHLLGRRNARITKFPTLRFVGASRLMATRWTRLSDITLMLVRMGIIAAAVIALAGPLLLTEGREVSGNREIVRAIIVDTSASMSRPVASSVAGPASRSGGVAAETGRDVAQREAARLASDAATSVIVQTSNPSQAVSGAFAWLETRQGRREVVVISDFQAGALVDADMRSVPPDIGIGVVRVGVATRPGPIEVMSRQGSAEIIARVARDSAGADVEWIERAGAAGGVGEGVIILAGVDERARADAARDAATRVVAVTPGPGRPIAIVLPGYEGRAALVRNAQPVSEPWMGDVIAALGRDPILVAAVRDADVSATGAESSFVAVARTATGEPAVVAARESGGGSARLLLVSQIEAGSLASAALIAAAMRASSIAVPVAELDPATLSEQAVAAWRRDAATGPESATADSDLSDARWFWLVALVLIGVEAWMRRAPRARVVQEVARDRAA